MARKTRRRRGTKCRTRKHRGKWNKEILRDRVKDKIYPVWVDLVYIRKVLLGPACFIPNIDRFPS